MAQRLLLNEIRRRDLERRERLAKGEAAPCSASASQVFTAASEPLQGTGAGVDQEAAVASIAAPSSAGTGVGVDEAVVVDGVDVDLADGDTSPAASQASGDSEGWFPDAAEDATVDAKAVAAMPPHMRAKFIGGGCCL